MSDQSNHAVGALEQTYASALLDMAWAQGEQVALDIEQQLREVLTLLAAEPKIGQLLASRVLSTETRQGVIDRVFKGKVHDLVYRFLQVINQKDRMDVLQGIIRGYIEAVGTKQGKLDVHVFVPAKLSDADAGALAGRLGEVLGKIIILHQEVDARLIGGLKIRIADELIDGSVLTQLRTMREQMILAGREKARTAAPSLN